MSATLQLLAKSFFNSKTESFSTDTSVPSVGPAAFGMVLVALAIMIIPGILFAYGASSLSFCLNQSMGWAILCFMFPGFYYPYYAIFLNPLCNKTTPAQVGGRRR